MPYKPRTRTIVVGIDTYLDKEFVTLSLRNYITHLVLQDQNDFKKKKKNLVKD